MVRSYGEAAVVGVETQDIFQLEEAAPPVVADQAAATERLDGFALRNQEPLESLAGTLKLGNQIGIEQAGSIKELTALIAETAQLKLVRAMSTGHDGTLCTLPSNGAAEALRRLPTLVAEAQPSFPCTGITSALDVVLQLEGRGNKRRLAGIWPVPRGSKAGVGR